METVEERGGQREVLPITDEVLSGLQSMADTFYNLKLFLKKLMLKIKFTTGFLKKSSIF
ncbi:hypothetical protein [Nostoc sphaeroides]|uniref:Aliphatic sulfonate ABC transporter substrate-binding protein n=1 Tax=Nostoc sphaeroides CCNUC1 TaxID=2653204 RepID=A0A5P8WBH4_9NOSO|nr:hypothetical protein [Nostoc sphaeroides]QFS49964.1 aliphatic sulfonate ABC transporter substrate-binding protein [Nostoc sphaeroides CCNUC1]